MGKKLDNAAILQLIKERPNSVTFETCYRCNGVEEGGSMQQRNPDGDDFDVICDDCSVVVKMNDEGDWKMNVHEGNTTRTSHWLGELKVVGGINQFKNLVMDLGATFDDAVEPPNYISDFMFSVEAEYQTFYGLDQDFFENVHDKYEDYKNAPKNLVVSE